ncbi:hypothetical protein MTR_7g023270 [Medicago truncatula]|uniref:Uncharacterized protein n=1 Tax=Medicago truncatula TaxID=3880 RepID=A0A072TXK8_MEDTR|nr:hypothetical protein MTR_7g023270 [Medicago truncatula]
MVSKSNKNITQLLQFMRLKGRRVGDRKRICDVESRCSSNNNEVYYRATMNTFSREVVRQTWETHIHKTPSPKYYVPDM